MGTSSSGCVRPRRRAVSWPVRSPRWKAPTARAFHRRTDVGFDPGRRGGQGGRAFQRRDGPIRGRAARSNACVAPTSSEPGQARACPALEMSDSSVTPATLELVVHATIRSSSGCGGDREAGRGPGWGGRRMATRPRRRPIPNTWSWWRGVNPSARVGGCTTGCCVLMAGGTTGRTLGIPHPTGRRFDNRAHDGRGTRTGGVGPGVLLCLYRP